MKGIVFVNAAVVASCVACASSAGWALGTGDAIWLSTSTRYWNVGREFRCTHLWWIVLAKDDRGWNVWGWINPWLVVIVAAILPACWIVRRIWWRDGRSQSLGFQVIPAERGREIERTPEPGPPGRR